MVSIAQCFYNNGAFWIGCYQYITGLHHLFQSIGHSWTDESPVGYLFDTLSAILLGVGVLGERLEWNAFVGMGLSPLMPLGRAF